VEARLEEAVGLARAIRLDVVGAEIAPITRPRPGSLLGSGTLDTLGALISDNGVGVVVIDGALSPVQQRTLERHWQTKVIERTGALHREARRRIPYPVVALVGYTNAGKSTLFNRLTRSSVTAGDMLFATLDPTMRRLELPSGRTAILSDTVGFISDLPTHLV